MKLQKVSLDQISQLSDWEILSAIVFCNRVLDPKTVEDIMEAEGTFMFFFDSDTDVAIHMMNRIRDVYMKEFQKRRSN